MGKIETHEIRLRNTREIRTYIGNESYVIENLLCIFVLLVAMKSRHRNFHLYSANFKQYMFPDHHNLQANEREERVWDSIEFPLQHVHQ